MRVFGEGYIRVRVTLTRVRVRVRVELRLDFVVVMASLIELIEWIG